MDKNEGIEKLFFDFASESRLGILRELREKNVRMNELSKKLDLTPTEVFRQLQRLTEALIVQKLPDGTYAITNYGKLTLQLLPSLEFTFRNKAYFLNHDVSRLPYQFVNRIGELSSSSLCMDSIENVNRSVQDFKEAEKYAWVMGEKALESYGPAMPELVSKGIKFRFLLSDGLLPNYNSVPGESLNVEKRTLTNIPCIIFCTEKKAGVCLRSTDGRMDYACFVSKDQMFVTWARDLFLHYWDLGKPY
jgi:predicted transcriptional regulator